MKDIFCTAVGFAAGMISWVVGGFDTPILALILCMAVDYVTGLIVAGVFHTSPKTKGGGLDSRVGWKGLARKFVTLLIVVVANLADVLLELHYVRDAVIVGFCVNECISILENAGLMGIRIPGVLTAALEKLGEETYDETAA
ncbi:MAG: phage holin family protein [Ruminococcaceae bacterium]|nr:phage holin family protein [Oscillospiraceae bacterium]